MNIHAFRCRNRNVFDYAVLTQTLLGMLSNMRYMCRKTFLNSITILSSETFLTPGVSEKRLWTCILNVFVHCLHNTGCRVFLYCSNYSQWRLHVNAVARMCCKLLGLAFVLAVKRKFWRRILIDEKE